MRDRWKIWWKIWFSRRILTVGAAVSRLEAPAAAPAGNPSCCSACNGSFIKHVFVYCQFITSRERVARLPGAGGDVEALGGPETQDHWVTTLERWVCSAKILYWKSVTGQKSHDSGLGKLNTGSNKVSLTEAGWHVCGGGLLLLYNILVANWAEALVASVAVESATILAQGWVVLLHIPVPAVHG